MIAIVSHPYHRGGATQWFCDLIQYLVSINSPHIFITLEPRTKTPERPLLSSLLPQGSNMVIRNVPNYFNFLSLHSKANYISTLINSVVPKGATLIPSDDLSYWAAVGMTSGYKKLGILHGDDSFYYEVGERFREYYSGFVAVSRRIKNKLSFTKNVVVIPCGFDLTNHSISEKKENLVLYVGRLDERSKRISDLIPIMNGFLRNNPNYRFVIIGDGRDAKILDEAIDNSPFVSKIQRFNWSSRETVLKQMAKSKILLLTSNFEGMPLTAIEALAFGNQVVSSTVSGIEDCNIETVHLFKTGDIEKAIGLIEYAINKDTGLATKTSIRFSKETFDIPILASKYFHFIEEIEISSFRYEGLNKSRQTSIDKVTDSLVAYGKYIFSKLKRTNT